MIQSVGRNVWFLVHRAMLHGIGWQVSGWFRTHGFGSGSGIAAA
jgi:hypothetical protein